MGEEISMTYLMEKLRVKDRELGTEDWVNIVLEKLKEWLIVVEDFFGALIAKFEEIFPPETRGEQLRHWLQIAIPFLIAAAVLLMCICCCRLCCRGGRAVRMMKAPGRDFRMPRHVFEGNPRSYFRGLRGKPLV